MWSMYMKMMGRGLLLGTTVILLVFFLWMVKYLKNFQIIDLLITIIGLWLLSLLHLIYPRISLVFLTNSSLMEWFCKNIQLILELLKDPFLGLIFSDYILMTFLMMLSLILLLSMLILLLSTLRVIRYKTFGNN